MIGYKKRVQFCFECELVLLQYENGIQIGGRLVGPHQASNGASFLCLLLAYNPFIARVMLFLKKKVRSNTKLDSNRNMKEQKNVNESFYS